MYSGLGGVLLLLGLRLRGGDGLMEKEGNLSGDGLMEKEGNLSILGGGCLLGKKNVLQKIK